MKRILNLIVALTASLSAASASAEYFSEDFNFIYRETPYSQLFSSEEGIVLMGEFATRALVSTLTSAKNNGLFPDAVATLEDIERLRRAQDRVGDMVKYLNSFIAEQRRRPGRFDIADLIPDAFLVFTGQRFSLNIGKGVGGAVSLGLVLMPMRVQQYDKRTGALVSTYWTVRTSVVGWPSAEAGLGAGGGLAPQLGLGMIWDLNDSFVKPDQFWGVGVGPTTTMTLGWGMNARAGVVSNWEMPGWADFAYATIATEFGPAVEMSTRAHVSPFISGPALLGLIDSSSRKAFEDMLKQAQKEITDALRDEINGPLMDRLQGLIRNEIQNRQN